MKRCVVGMVAVLMGAVVAMSPAQARKMPGSFADLAEGLLPSVVNISSTHRTMGQGDMMSPDMPGGVPLNELFQHFFQMPSPNQLPKQEIKSLGSGFIVDKDGIIITNHHVVKGAEEVSIVFHDDSVAKGEVVGRDPKTDLAVLKVDTDKELKPVSLGDSAKVRVGDWILAVGNPFGFGNTVTAGIVSARARDIHSGPYDDFIQTDASINRGNSGGPMFNLDGEVIGINTAIFSPSGGSVGIGFAIPSNMARKIIDDIQEYGHPRRGWIGVRIQTVTEEIAESLGLEKARGALVAGVENDGPAEKAGIESGDVILGFDEQDVDEMRALPRLVADTEIGKKIPVKVWRDGREVTLYMKVAEMEMDEDLQAADEDETWQKKPVPSGAIEALGMRLRPLTESTRRNFDLPPKEKGAVVTRVAPRSAAYEKGIRRGDLIEKVNRETVKNPRQIREEIEKSRDAGRESVLLLLRTETGMHFVALPLEEDDAR